MFTFTIVVLEFMGGENANENLNFKKIYIGSDIHKYVYDTVKNYDIQLVTYVHMYVNTITFFT